jgi:hypothetical protein
VQQECTRIIRYHILTFSFNGVQVYIYFNCQTFVRPIEQQKIPLRDEQNMRTHYESYMNQVLKRDKPALACPSNLIDLESILYDPSDNSEKPSNLRSLF